jgi:hypothetical protein
MRRSIKQLLDSDGLMALTFEDAEDFLTHARSCPVPLAVLYVWLPKTSGLEVQARLNEVSPNTRRPDFIRTTSTATTMAAITGKGPSSPHEIFYLGESTVGAVRIDDYKFRFIDQPQGWVGEKTKPDVPYITNLRFDPFERKGWPNDGTKEGAQQYFDWFKYQFWRFVFVQQVMGKELQTFLDFPPMQRGASFNLDAVKAEMAKRMEQAEAASKGPSQ